VAFLAQIYIFCVDSDEELGPSINADYYSFEGYAPNLSRCYTCSGVGQCNRGVCECDTVLYTNALFNNLTGDGTFPDLVTFFGPACESRHGLWTRPFFLAQVGIGVILFVHIAFTLAFTFWLYYYRDNKYVVATNPAFGVLTIFGLVCGIIAEIYGMDQVTRVSCRMFFSFALVSFSLIFGSILSKTWHKVQLFVETAKVNSEDNASLRLFSFALFYVGGNMVLLAIWYALFPVETEVSLPNADHLQIVVWCLVGDGFVVAEVIALYNFLFVIYGIRLANKLTRSVQLAKSLNDAVEVSYAIYHVTLIMAVAVPMLAIIRGTSPNLNYFTRCLLVGYLGISTTLFVYLKPAMNVFSPTVESSLSHDAAQVLAGRKATGTLKARRQSVQEEIQKLNLELDKCKKESSSLHANIQNLSDSIEAKQSALGIDPVKNMEAKKLNDEWKTKEFEAKKDIAKLRMRLKNRNRQTIQNPDQIKDAAAKISRAVAGV